MASGQISPSIAMQNQLTKIDGQIHPVTLLGRWIARAQGADDAEMKREAKQRKLQEERAGLYAPGGDHDGDGLLDYRQLYALWERQNWRATSSTSRSTASSGSSTPREAQESTIWSLGSFYVGEERVTADLAPFLQAAPTGEIELFLATQLVDEARHAAFFDRFGAEVMCLSADDFRGRMREVEQILLSPWREVFDDGLRDVADRIQAKPDDLDLFVEGITTYHMVVEGFLAVTGQTLIRDYMLEHSLYPGFLQGVRARGARRAPARGLRRALPARRHRGGPAPRARPWSARRWSWRRKAAYVFAPPYVTARASTRRYGYTSRQIYGFAYRKLRRRMKVLGIEIPPAEELMPGPIDGTTEFAAVPAAGAKSASNGGSANGSRRSRGGGHELVGRSAAPARSRPSPIEASANACQPVWGSPPPVDPPPTVSASRGRREGSACSARRLLLAVGLLRGRLFLAARGGGGLVLRGHCVRHRLRDRSRRRLLRGDGRRRRAILGDRGDSPRARNADAIDAWRGGA